jgi:hypothetical protein
MGSGFDNSIYLDFHQAELQLFITPHKLETFIFSVLDFGSWILLSNSFSCCILSVCLLYLSPSLDCPVGESSLQLAGEPPFTVLVTPSFLTLRTNPPFSLACNLSVTLLRYFFSYRLENTLSNSWVLSLL